MDEVAEESGWEHIPPELAAVARRSGITAAELDAFRDDPAHQDDGPPDFSDEEWDRILAPVPEVGPGADIPVRPTDGRTRPCLPAREVLAEPDADDRHLALARLERLRLRDATAPGADPSPPRPRGHSHPADTAPDGTAPVDEVVRGTEPVEQIGTTPRPPADEPPADEPPADEPPAGDIGLIADDDGPAGDPRHGLVDERTDLPTVDRTRRPTAIAAPGPRGDGHPARAPPISR